MHPSFLSLLQFSGVYICLCELLGGSDMIAGLIVIHMLIVYAQASPKLPLVSKYNEVEAKILASLSAGAYSTDPEKCVIK